MTTHIGAGLPPATRPASGDGSTQASAGDSAQQQQAWQREMERAQLSGWFKPTPKAPDGGRDSSRTLAENRDAHPRATARQPNLGGARFPLPAATSAMPWSQPATRPHTLQPLSIPEASALQLQALPRASAVMPSAGTNPVAESQPPVESRIAPQAGSRWPTAAVLSPSNMAPPEDTASADDAQYATAEDQAQAPVRLHEESTSSGQAVWIAMRANDRTLAALLPRLVLDLQHARAQQGRHLYQVVCNGRVVWQDGEFIQGNSPSHDMFDSTGSKEI